MQNTNTAQLIPIATQAIAGEERQAVNARELHTFLEVEARFNDWIARRIEEYGFIENADFLVTQIQVTKPTRQDGNLFYSNLSKNPQGTLSKPLEKTRRGRPTKEYFLTLDTAKELAMVERNAKGKGGTPLLHRMRAAGQAGLLIPARLYQPRRSSPRMGGGSGEKRRAAQNPD